MSYQVLARKWRPQTFAELVGQAHVVRALTNALEQDRLHHAYLFSGTRGVGKTTVARILARCLNCEEGVSANPCGVCASCREIEEGRFVDLIEVDAASRTRVEETRELLENVPYAPTRGRFKVYLIDEVHMFSRHSFNALLKTLEEPPPHVKFLLATTDPEKLPVTILSRCLQFNLKRIPPEQIENQLTRILTQEAVPSESAAVMRLARAADGSMRDALSLLDQAIAFGNGKVGDEDTRSMLGDIAVDAVYDVASAIAEGDAQGLLETVDRLAGHSPDFVNLLRALVAVLHRVAVAQFAPDSASTGLVDDAQVKDLAARLTREDVQLYYQIALLGQRDLPLAPDPRSGFEMVLLRMLAFSPVPVGAAQHPRAAAAPPAREPATPATVASPPPPVAADQPPPAAPPSAAPVDGGWRELVERLALKGLTRELANNCVCVALTADRISLQLDAAHTQLRSQSVEARLRAALTQHFGNDMQLDIVVGDGASANETPAITAAREKAARHRSACEAITGDENVKALQDAFSARVVPDLVEPLDK